MTDQAENPQQNEGAAAATESRAAETPNVNLVALVTDVVKFLVDSPDEVRVEEFPEGRNNIVLELQVAQNDVGKVIGKQGRTVRSLRNLLDAAGSKLGKRVQLEIIEDDDDYDDDQSGNGNSNDAPDENFGNR
jgi:uncharacterized protein